MSKHNTIVVSDATGKDIVVNRLYGYTEGNEGLFENFMILVWGFEGSIGYDVLPRVRGLIFRSGVFCNNTNGNGFYIVGEKTISGTNRLWPLDFDVELKEKI